MTDPTPLSAGEPVGPETEPGVEGATVAPPMIVIEYRRGLASRLLPPLAILLAAVAITAYERRGSTRPDVVEVKPPAAPAPPADSPAPAQVDGLLRTMNRPGEASPATRPEPAPAADAAAARPAADAAPKAPGVPAAPAAEAAVPAENPAPAATVADREPVRPTAAEPAPPAAVASASPFDLDNVGGLQALPPNPVVPPAPMPGGVAGADAAQAGRPKADAPDEGSPFAAAGNQTPPGEVSREEILNDIQREAAEVDARQRDMAEMKPRARALLLAEEVARVQSSRGPFREAIRQSLTSMGAGAGPEIYRLCEQYGRQTLPEVRTSYNRGKRTLPARMSRKEEVEFMRSCGIPEPVILDFLAHLLHKTINTRGGPRDENEVLVRAAQLLLSFPVDNARQPKAPGGAIAGVPPAADPGVRGAAGDPNQP